MTPKLYHLGNIDENNMHNGICRQTRGGFSASYFDDKVDVANKECIGTILGLDSIETLNMEKHLILLGR